MRKALLNDQLTLLNNQQIRVCDIMQPEGTTLNIPNDQVSPQDLLISGKFCRNRELRKGLFLHGGDALEEQAFTVDSTQDAGLTCIFFLKGEVEVTIGGQRFDFKNDRHNIMSAAALIKTTQESFRRKTKQPQHTRHLVVTATPEWLNGGGFTSVHDAPLNSPLFNRHMTSLRWNPSPRLCALVRELLTPSVLVPELFNLYLESRTIEIITEVISTMMQRNSPHDRSSTLTRYHHIRLQQAKELISTNLEQNLSVEAIARETGVSVSALQRLFHRFEGQSVFSYVRCLRLDKAMFALKSCSANVQEASVMAGYGSPANFTTAFKRRFGITPREAAKQN